MINKQLTYILLGIVFGIVILIGFLKDCKGNKLEIENNLYKGMLQDTLKKYKDKEGNQVAQIALLTDLNSNQFLKIKSKDAIIIELQQAVKEEKNKIKNGGSVTVINSSTNFTGTTTTTITSTNPVINGDTIRLYPVYETRSKDTLWIKYVIKSSKDSTNLDLQVKNKYKVVIGSVKDGWFKRKPIAEVTNYNPYTDTKSMRAFEVKDTRKNRISLGLQGGYGITLRGLSPYVGLGINFRLL